MSLATGTPAPAFSLYDTDKKLTTLADFKGKNLVILFFPLAFTSVCTAELCSMRDNLATYNGLNADVVAISVDSPFVLGKFKEEQQLNFPLLSDFNKEVSKAYGAYYDNFVLDLKGVSKRAAFVVDKTGNLQYAEVLDSAGNLPDFEKIKETLAKL
ncbi:Peroxiredoxin [Chitinophaga costaii]|uniref:Peroxiredoxin n=1 Tax=Chitinophaga costaii TaxID=1335309 RepID=A0A1C4BZW3_9BACT|nr:redoxin domain-containing protein [Chitinophaga costaii]PUZ27404.1 peroxiredoxin [Chitinophaga costaii]SCC12312.1 Peroxiredoxin [Chitinophaga costaii]